MKRFLRLWLPILLIVIGAVWLAWYAAGPGALPPPLIAPTTVKVAKPPAPRETNSTNWVAPEGDPVERYKVPGLDAKQRKDLISNFMALGHDNNAFMLIAALSDPDPAVRFFAVESASALPPEEAREVYRRAAFSEDADVREMCWSLSAPHPIENRAYIYSEALEKGSNTVVEEALAEMGSTPERPLFEMMMSQALQIKNPQRVERLRKELQQWLEPGGGEVPQFRSVQEMAAWWKKTHTAYDQFMLRVDQ
jgi:hypothetical protein